MAHIDSSTNITAVQLKDQGSTPSTPASGFKKLFGKALGLFVVDSAGVERQILTSIGCRVYNSGDESIADSTPTALTFDSERYDTDTMHSTSVNTGRITMTTAGKYLVSATIRFDANSTGERQFLLKVNGATFIAEQRFGAVAAPAATSTTISTIYDFAANDYVEIFVQQTSGGSLAVKAAGNFSPEFMAQRIG